MLPFSFPLLRHLPLRHPAGPTGVALRPVVLSLNLFRCILAKQLALDCYSHADFKNMVHMPLPSPCDGAILKGNTRLPFQGIRSAFAQAII